jgi:hypothetical protein
MRLDSQLNAIVQLLKNLMTAVPCARVGCTQGSYGGRYSNQYAFRSVEVNREAMHLTLMFRKLSSKFVV